MELDGEWQTSKRYLNMSATADKNVENDEPAL